jgi:hypothetical protein
MISIDWNPSKQTLRTFSLGLIVLSLVSAAWVSWQQPVTTQTVWSCAIAGGIGILGACYPPVVRWIYVGWTLAVFPIGWITLQLILILLFLGLITPIGFLLRQTGHDPLQLGQKPEATTYWTRRNQLHDPRRHFRQY